MGKRSSFERKPRDFYPTPYQAVLPLLPHLKENTHYCEPCAGDGALIKHLSKHGHLCVDAFDIEPKAECILQRDALLLGHTCADYIITNPSWDRKLLHPMIERFSSIRPTWLLFDGNWLFTKQANQYLKRLHKVVVVGRIKWIPDSKHVGKDDCCWYLFDKEKEGNILEFVGK